MKVYDGPMIKRHYDKVIVGCCFLFLFANLGMASTSFSLYQPYIVAIEGVGHSGGSLILSVRTAVSLLAMVFVDRYYTALDIRKGVLLATLCTAFGFVVYGFAQSLPFFMAGAALEGLGYGLGGMVAVTYIANRWFAGEMGSMVGFASMGSGFATILMPLAMVNIIESSSLSTAFLIEAVLAAAIAILVFAVLRNRPEDVAMTHFSSQSTKKGRRVHREMKEAPEREHLFLLTAMIGVGLFSCCGGTYISVLATSSGFDALLAASLVSILGVALTIAKFVTGELFDHIGVPAGSAVVFACGLVGYGLCSLAEAGSAAIMVAGAILVGTGMSLGSVGVSIWSIDLSSPKNRTREIRNFQVAYSIGSFIANTLPGIMKDALGTYTVSYGAIVVIGALAAGIILRYYRKYSTVNKQPEPASEDAGRRP